MTRVTWRRSTVIHGGLGILLLTVGLAAPVGAQAQGDTDASQIQLWNLSVSQVGTHKNFTPDMQAALNRITDSGAYPNRPDVFSVLELPYSSSWATDDSPMHRFVTALEDKTGLDYNHVHGDQQTPACNRQRSRKCANTLILWRSDRFERAGASGNVHRWHQLEDRNGDNDCADSSDVSANRDQIAVLLHDKLQDRNLVVTGVHFTTASPIDCVERNLQLLSSELDNRWADRPLTVVTGDLNEYPHSPNGTVKSRQERNPECWYDRFSAAHANGDGCGADHPAGGYYDTVWVDAGEAVNPSSAICHQWTLSNVTIRDRNADPCSLLALVRLDYFWVRYEVDGAFEPLTIEQISDRIVKAGTDIGYHQNDSFDDTSGTGRYGDHRAIHLTIAW